MAPAGSVRQNGNTNRIGSRFNQTGERNQDLHDGSLDSVQSPYTPRRPRPRPLLTRSISPAPSTYYGGLRELSPLPEPLPPSPAGPRESSAEVEFPANPLHNLTITPYIPPLRKEKIRKRKARREQERRLGRSEPRWLLNIPVICISDSDDGAPMKRPRLSGILDRQSQFDEVLVITDSENELGLVDHVNVVDPDSDVEIIEPSPVASHSYTNGSPIGATRTSPFVVADAELTATISETRDNSPHARSDSPTRPLLFSDPDSSFHEDDELLAETPQWSDDRKELGRYFDEALARLETLECAELVAETGHDLIPPPNIQHSPEFPTNRSVPHVRISRPCVKILWHWQRRFPRDDSGTTSRDSTLAPLVVLSKAAQVIVATVETPDEDCSPTELAYPD
ncbi:unnamed protein product [Mycena citricolor]|uniref:Uncharacterized protein n=1 Tax=Mycena citricolor TaxID=2018698 RepID=A0AAD2Q7D8_9AGAR|nr:unnamed protein product [Mycena citricolor]